MNTFGPQPIIIEYNRDHVLISYGYFQTKSEWTQLEVERGYNIFGEPLEFSRGAWKHHRVLCMGDGIKRCKDYSEAIELLGKMFPSEFIVNTKFVVYGADKIGAKFEYDSMSEVRLSEQTIAQSCFTCGAEPHEKCKDNCHG